MYSVIKWLECGVGNQYASFLSLICLGQPLTFAQVGCTYSEFLRKETMYCLNFLCVIMFYGNNLPIFFSNVNIHMEVLQDSIKEVIVATLVLAMSNIGGIDGLLQSKGHIFGSHLIRRTVTTAIIKTTTVISGVFNRSIICKQTILSIQF